MTSFYLNNELIRTDAAPSSALLDFVRYDQHLTGTKIGCREGDCGACTVLLGELAPDGHAVTYQSMTSCCTPLGNAQGKHVVTVEGINQAGGQLTPVQQAIVAEGGSQCGFCTVGFVMALTGHSLREQPATPANTRAAMDGNICRCTGYKSLERAAEALGTQLARRPADGVLAWLSERQFVPAYFREMPARLAELRASAPSSTHSPTQQPTTLLGGGTDLLVQRLAEVRAQPVQLVFDQTSRRGIRQAGGRVVLGAATTATHLLESELLRGLLPGWEGFLKLVSSTPIRNMGTVAGNFVNASPIGDLTIMFLALGAELTLTDANGNERHLPLPDFYTGYKQLAKAPDEQLTEISFPAPRPGEVFHFEKVSKRQYLDIASVNSAAWLRVENGIIQEARLSAGGVGPVPLLLRRTSAFLAGRAVSAATLAGANEVMQAEISPIADVRGSVEYKRLLLRQLLTAHLLQVTPTVANAL
jgi:xanthine dehydrogenase small subunit